MPNRFAVARLPILALAALLLVAARVEGAEIMLSTTTDATLGGLSFRDGDIVIYDDVLGTATLVFSEDAFSSGNESVDSFQVLPNGNYVLSTGGGATLGGLTFRDGDAVEYDPVNDIATLLFSEDLFASGANLDGFQLLPNGHFLISSTDDETLGGLVFKDGSIVDYDPVGDTATLFLDEDVVFSNNADIGGFHVLADGRVALSTLGSSTFTIAGLTILNGDIALFDPADDSALLIFSEAAFGADQDVNAVFVVTLIPEPGTGSLAGIGLIALAAARRRANTR